MIICQCQFAGHTPRSLLHRPDCDESVQVTEVLAAKSAQRREAALHRQLVLLSRAMQAWYSWLGMHLANATAKQERLLRLQVRDHLAACITVLCYITLPQAQTLRARQSWPHLARDATLLM